MSDIAAAPPRPAVTTRALATLALGGVAWFVVGVLILHALRSDLPPATHMISEFALGPWGWLQTLNFLALATGAASLALATRHRALPIGTATTALLSLFAVTTLLSAIFPTGSGSWQAQVHELVGVLGFLALIVAAFATARSLREADQSRRLRASQLWGVAMVVSFPLVPILGDAGMGIGQRLFIACALGWLATLAVSIRNTVTPDRRDV